MQKRNRLYAPAANTAQYLQSNIVKGHIRTPKLNHLYAPFRKNTYKLTYFLHKNPFQGHIKIRKIPRLYAPAPKLT